MAKIIDFYTITYLDDPTLFISGKSKGTRSSRKRKTKARVNEPLQIQPVHPKGDQSWMFTGRTDAETEAAILWPPDAKN